MRRDHDQVRTTFTNTRKSLFKEAVRQFPALTLRIRRNNRKARRTGIDVAMYRMGLETIAKAEGIKKRVEQRKEEV
jgi:hypothetical protein